MKKFFQVAGNRPTFRATCKDQDLTVIDLTGSTVTLFWRVDGSTPVSSAVMTIDNATGGLISYQFGVGELVAGTNRVEVLITDASGAPFRNRKEVILEVRRAA